MEILASLESAVLYIEANLGGDLKVEAVARHAGYSPYHLTRMFAAMFGEPIGNYIKKRRLTNAAKQLLYTDMRVLDIALENGFDAAESFARAFKAVFLVTPTQYRKNRLDLLIGNKRELDAPRMRHLAENLTVQPKAVEVEPVKVVGMRCETTLHDNVVPQLWQRFMPRVPEIHNAVLSGRGFGICETENTIFTMNGDAKFTEMAALEVTAFGKLPQGMVAKEMPGGKYMRFTHRGTLATLGMTFDYIWGTWLMVSGYELDHREDYEVYDQQRFLGYDHPDSELDIYIPVK